MSELRNTVEEYPWLGDLPASACWAWVAFYCYVAKHGRPAGHISNPHPKEWAHRLNVAPGDFLLMLDVAIRNCAVTVDRDGNAKRLCVPSLASAKALSDSTMRVRRHRAKKQTKKKGTKPEPLPAFTRKDALYLRSLFISRNASAPRVLPEALMGAMTMMMETGCVDPISRIKGWIKGDYKPPENPIHFLNRHVATYCDADDVELALPSR